MMERPKDLLKLVIDEGADWSYLDKGAKDELIRELIKRILKLEEDQHNGR